MSSQHFATILIIGVFAWSIYRRVRRNIGRQKLRPRRATASIVILSAISILIIGTSLQNINLPLGFAAGHFYTPNMHIGIALSVLFVGRIAYRFIMLNDAAAAQNHPQPFQSPLTLFILGLYVGYYLVYQAGLLIHSRDKK